MPKRSYRSCQSCGMPLDRDEAGGGTNGDGSKSDRYCSHCYKAGEFVLPDLTAVEMQKRVKGRLKEIGFPGIAAALAVRGIPKLERWKSR